MTPRHSAPALATVLYAHLTITPRPVRVVRPEIPVELAGLVARMMAKSPDSRFQEPAGVADALAPFFKRRKAVSKSSDAESPSPLAEQAWGGPTGSARPPA